MLPLLWDMDLLELPMLLPLWDMPMDLPELPAMPVFLSLTQLLPLPS
jgi:hypothetical protein